MANAKITDLTADTAPSSTDLVETVKDPGGTPLSRKVTLADAVEAGMVDIGAKVYNNANIACTGGATTTLTFNSETWDTDAIHDTVSNTDRLTCKTAGKYAIGAQVVMASALPAGSVVWIAHDSKGRVAQSTLTLAATLFTVVDLAVNDYLTLEIYIASGGNVNCIYGSPNEYSPFFEMQRIG